MDIRIATGAFLLAAVLPAAAQVSVNPKALEPLGGSRTHASTAESGHHRHARHGRAATQHHRPAARRHGTEKKAEQAKPAARHPEATHAEPAAKRPRSLVKQPPVVPLAPPPAPVLAPLAPPPPKHPAPQPVPVPVVAGAMGEATALPDGLRLTFAAGSADLNPATDAALQKLAHDMAAKPDMTITVKAYARGSPDDPSTPRRLSLTRALIARSVLLSEGVASTRIFVRALGPNTGDGPPDRVDVTVSAPVRRGKS